MQPYVDALRDGNPHLTVNGQLRKPPLSVSTIKYLEDQDEEESPSHHQKKGKGKRKKKRGSGKRREGGHKGPGSGGSHAGGRSQDTETTDLVTDNEASTSKAVALKTGKSIEAGPSTASAAVSTASASHVDKSGYPVSSKNVLRT